MVRSPVDRKIKRKAITPPEMRSAKSFELQTAASFKLQTGSNDEVSRPAMKRSPKPLKIQSAASFQLQTEYEEINASDDDDLPLADPVDGKLNMDHQSDSSGPCDHSDSDSI